MSFAASASSSGDDQTAASDACCFYMPAQRTVARLQWAAGEKYVSFPLQADYSRFFDVHDAQLTAEDADAKTATMLLLDDGDNRPG